MSIWGFAKRSSRAYTKRLNVKRAMQIMGSAKEGASVVYNQYRGAGRGMGVSAMKALQISGGWAGKKLHKWALKDPKSLLTKGIRTGTVGASAILAGSILSPRNNRRPYQR